MDNTGIEVPSAESSSSKALLHTVHVNHHLCVFLSRFGIIASSLTHSIETFYSFTSQIGRNISTFNCYCGKFK